MSENDERSLHNELTEPHRSKAAKIGWKRHRSKYNAANRKKERENMSTFYSVANDLKEYLQSINEAKVVKDNEFEYDFEIDLENIAGGIAFSINKETNDVSFSVKLSENKRGAYRLLTEEGTDITSLYDNLKEDIKTLSETIDSEMKNILSKYGLKET